MSRSRRWSDRSRSQARKRLYVPGATCHICGRELDLTLIGLQLPDSPTIDHVVPLCQGGSSRVDNLLPAHMRLATWRSRPLTPRASMSVEPTRRADGGGPLVSVQSLLTGHVGADRRRQATRGLCERRRQEVRQKMKIATVINAQPGDFDSDEDMAEVAAARIDAAVSFANLSAVRGARRIRTSSARLAREHYAGDVPDDLTTYWSSGGRNYQRRVCVFEAQVARLA